jgi:hypothetical protein
MANYRPSLSEMRSRLSLYLSNIVPGADFSYKEKSDGFLGTRLFCSREWIEISLSGETVAEVGRILSTQTKLQKPGEIYACPTEKRDRKGDKHYPVFNPDRGKEVGQRVFNGPTLINVIQGNWQPSVSQS